MNTRLEIASRLMAALVAEFATGKPEPWKELWDDLRDDALREADALIAEEARTRPNSSISSKSSPPPDDLRAVAEAVTWAIDRALLYGDFDHSDHAREISAACRTALARARALGLGGGK